MFFVKISKSKIREMDSVSISARTDAAYQVRVGSFTYNDMKLHCIGRMVNYDGLYEFGDFQGFQALSHVS